MSNIEQLIANNKQAVDQQLAIAENRRLLVATAQDAQTRKHFRKQQQAALKQAQWHLATTAKLTQNLERKNANNNRSH